VDQILADEQYTPTQAGQMPAAAGTVYWPLTDNLGTVRDLVQHDPVTNVTTVANHITYDAYGKPTSETNPNVDHLYGFTGRERDEESGLMYYRARYYDAPNGRFISEDPIGFAAGDTNIARYVGNAPTNFTDPSGLQEQSGNRPHQDLETLDSAALEAEYARLEKEMSEIAGRMGRARDRGYYYDDDGRQISSAELYQQYMDARMRQHYARYLNERFHAGTGIRGISEEEARYRAYQAYLKEEERYRRQFAKDIWDAGWSVAAAFSGVGMPKFGRGGAMATGIAPGSGEALASARRDKGVPVPVIPPPTGPTHGHHSDPKFMGGNPKQPLTRMPPADHRDLHRHLNDFLRQKTDDAGNHMRPQRGNSGADIQNNFTPKQRQEAMAEFYKKYRDKYPDAARDFFNQHPHLQ
jgi:RHS repeat-associated protein